MAYFGDPVPADELLFRPKHSIIDQSLQAHLGAYTTNGDGFGIGWYGDGSGNGTPPALFKSTDPDASRPLQAKRGRAVERQWRATVRTRGRRQTRAGRRTRRHRAAGPTLGRRSGRLVTVTWCGPAAASPEPAPSEDCRGGRRGWRARRVVLATRSCDCMSLAA